MPTNRLLEVALVLPYFCPDFMSDWKYWGPKIPLLKHIDIASYVLRSCEISPDVFNNAFDICLYTYVYIHIYTYIYIYIYVNLYPSPKYHSLRKQASQKRLCTTPRKGGRHTKAQAALFKAATRASNLAHLFSLASEATVRARCRLLYHLAWICTSSLSAFGISAAASHRHLDLKLFFKHGPHMCEEGIGESSHHIAPPTPKTKWLALDTYGLFKENP